MAVKKSSNKSKSIRQQQKRAAARPLRVKTLMDRANKMGIVEMNAYIRRRMNSLLDHNIDNIHDLINTKLGPNSQLFIDMQADEDHELNHMIGKSYASLKRTLKKYGLYNSKTDVLHHSETTNLSKTIEVSIRNLNEVLSTPLKKKGVKDGKGITALQKKRFEGMRTELVKLKMLLDAANAEGIDPYANMDKIGQLAHDLNNKSVTELEVIKNAWGFDGKMTVSVQDKLLNSLAAGMEGVFGKARAGILRANANKFYKKGFNNHLLKNMTGAQWAKIKGSPTIDEIADSLVFTGLNNKQPSFKASSRSYKTSGVRPSAISKSTAKKGLTISKKAKAWQQNQAQFAALHDTVMVKESDARGAVSKEDLKKLMGYINSRMGMELSSLMTGPPTLQFRTGVFAFTSKVSAVQQVGKTLTLQTSYNRNPYAIFDKETGRAPWNSLPKRDPNDLIAQATRNLAKDAMMSNFSHWNINPQGIRIKGQA